MQVSIEMLQAYLAERYAGFDNDQGLFMKLIEEVGEVAEVLNQRRGYKAQTDQDLDRALAMELADLLHYTVALAAVHHLPLQEIILEKNKQASIKYQHAMNLEQYIHTKGDKGEKDVTD